MATRKKKMSEKESFQIIEKYVNQSSAEILNWKNHRAWNLRPNTYRFTVNLISLEFLISLMEDDKVKNVFFNPSIPPPGGSIDSISLRYKVYVEYY